jgi:hypothetical protein
MKAITDFTKSWGFAYVAFSIYFIVLLAPLWLLTVGPMWDANDYVYPVFTYLADSIREGRLALWDPYTNCGQPFHADPQHMVLNPIALLLGLAFKNTFLGFVLLWLLHWWWGGIGMLWLARYFGANSSGALIAAVSFAFSGFFLGHAEHTTFIIVAAWLPWIFGLADKAVATSRMWCALLAASALGLCALSSGYPVLVAFTGLGVALWLFLRFILFVDTHPLDTRTALQRAAWAGGTLTLMAVISIIVWSPNLHAFLTEAAGFTDRMSSVTSETSLYGMSFSWRAALSLVFPYSTILFYGANPINGIDWMLADISMTNAYMGAVAIPLACVWWFKSEYKRRPWWLLVFVIFMVVVSLGGKAGLRIVLNEVFPFLRLMRFNAAFRLFWILPLTLSAGLGFSLLSKSADNRRFFAKILAVWTAIALFVALVIKTCALGNGISLMDSFPRIYLPALIVLPTGLLLAWYWVKRDSATTSRIVLPLFVVVICADMGGHLYNNSFTVWTKLNIIDFLEKNHIRSTATNNGPWGREYESRTGFMNSHLVRKIPVVSGYVTFKTSDFNEILTKSRFAELLTSRHRFWLVPGVEKKPAGNEALRILSESGLGDPVPVYLEEPSRLFSPSRTIPGTFGSSNISYYAPEEIRIEVNVPGSAGGFLASTERYAAGWKAWIDGMPQKIEKNNLFFRGLYLPSGQHTVIWKYKPDWWWPLVALSYSTLFIMVGIAVRLMLKEKSGEATQMAHLNVLP